MITFQQMHPEIVIHSSHSFLEKETVRRNCSFWQPSFWVIDLFSSFSHCPHKAIPRVSAEKQNIRNSSKLLISLSMDDQWHPTAIFAQDWSGSASKAFWRIIGCKCLPSQTDSSHVTLLNIFNYSDDVSHLK